MYIRTKDGVYKVVKQEIIGIPMEVVNYPKTMEMPNGENETFIVSEILKEFANKRKILSQSENLAELCDEIVGIDNTCENGHQLLRAFPYKCANFWNGGVYGAIWCESGLKYVAKLNSKGEFELLW